MDRDVKDRVQSSPGYEEAYQTFNVLTIWLITEQVAAVSRGAVSAYAITSRLLRLKQTKEYATYSREFREAINDLIRQGTPEEVLQKLINTIFILGLNQDQFKDKLAVVYGQQDWPAYDEFAAELHIYAEATERMNNLKKDNEDGKIKANKAEHEDNNAYTRGCWNCGSLSHIRYECTKPQHTCETCNKRGHLERFCRITTASADRNNVKEKTFEKKSYRGEKNNNNNNYRGGEQTEKLNTRVEKNK
jgi:hypothetical protein